MPHLYLLEDFELASFVFKEILQTSWQQMFSIALTNLKLGATIYLSLTTALKLFEWMEAKHEQVTAYSTHMSETYTITS